MRGTGASCTCGSSARLADLNLLIYAVNQDALQHATARQGNGSSPVSIVELVVPGHRHWTILRALLLESGAAGNLSSDAHLAALAIKQEAELHSADSDFQRFRGLRWSNPLAAR